MPASRTLPEVPEVGGRIPPDTVHAVSVSLPRVQDVIGYEEKRSETMSRIKSGYPRFVAHPYVSELLAYFQSRLPASDAPCVVVSSPAAARALFSWAGYKDVPLLEEDGVAAFPLPSDQKLAAHLLSYIQHTGCLVSSGRAEDFLLERGLLGQAQNEDRVESGQGASQVRAEMARLNGLPRDEVYLSVSGMNGIYGAFKTIQEVQARAGREIWIQLGWLYVDNIRIIEKFAGGSEQIYNLETLDELKDCISRNTGKVAGIIAEIPTNPLLQTPDMESLYELCQKEGCALLADISVGSSVCVDVMSLCDVAVESLTKFATGSCDVMMGAVMLNPSSRFHDAMKENLDRNLEPPYDADADRVAFRIRGYEKRMEQIAENVNALCATWNQNPAVKRIFTADVGPCAENYRRIARNQNGAILPGGLITMELSGAMEPVYDGLQVLKGPSFGTDFTLVMLYLYLAHYELVSTPEGRQQLKSLDMDPGLFRISVGLEDPERIEQAFQLAFNR